jgi:hypothetical protein
MKTILKHLIIFCFTGLFFLLNCASVKAVTFNTNEDMDQNKKLAVVWTSGDKDVAEKMVFMYTYNAAKYKWWDEIHLIVWGPSSKLLSEDKDLQESITKMKEEGIQISACKACADLYNVSEKLEKIGIEVKYMGKALTEYLQTDYKVISF